MAKTKKKRPKCYSRALREIPKLVLTHYRVSEDYNGEDAVVLQRRFHLSEVSAKLIFSRLLDQDVITLTFGSIFHNQHIKGLVDLPREQQKWFLLRGKLDEICVYPSNSELARGFDEAPVAGRPFQRMLALGTPQFQLHAFEPAVMTRYVSDPRYEHIDDGTSIRVRISPELDEFDPLTPERDKVHINYLSHARGKGGRRFIVSFTRYLAKLSPDHQQHWNSYRVASEFEPDAAFLRRCLLGEPTYDRSIYLAFLQEQWEINAICRFLGRKSLFRRTFQGSECPDHFGPLKLPTLAELHSFLLVLDKLLSDNINKKFFGTDVDLKEREMREDVVIERDKGTLRLLEEWINKNAGSEAVARGEFKIFRDIRKERQSPAHTLDGNYLNEEFWQEQERLISEAYRALHRLRELLASMEGAKGYQPADWLREQRIKNLVPSVGVGALQPENKKY